MVVFRVRGIFKRFVSDLRAGGTAYDFGLSDGMVLEKDRIVLTFSLKEGINEIFQGKKWSCFALDCTF